MAVAHEFNEATIPFPANQNPADFALAIHPVPAINVQLHGYSFSPTLTSAGMYFAAR
jgi:hypothetical protein